MNLSSKGVIYAIEEPETSKVWYVLKDYHIDGHEKVNIVSFPDANAKYDCQGKHITITAHSGKNRAYLQLLGKCRSVVIMGSDVKVQLDKTDHLSTSGANIEVKANVVNSLSESGMRNKVMIERLGYTSTRDPSSQIYYVRSLLDGEALKNFKHYNPHVKQVENLNNL